MSSLESPIQTELELVDLVTTHWSAKETRQVRVGAQTRTELHASLEFAALNRAGKRGFGEDSRLVDPILSSVKQDKSSLEKTATELLALAEAVDLVLTSSNGMPIRDLFIDVRGLPSRFGFDIGHGCFATVKKSSLTTSAEFKQMRHVLKPEARVYFLGCDLTIPSVKEGIQRFANVFPGVTFYVLPQVWDSYVFPSPRLTAFSGIPKTSRHHLLHLRASI